MAGDDVAHHEGDEFAEPRLAQPRFAAPPLGDHPFGLRPQGLVRGDVILAPGVAGGGHVVLLVAAVLGEFFDEPDQALPGDFVRFVVLDRVDDAVGEFEQLTVLAVEFGNAEREGIVPAEAQRRDVRPARSGSAVSVRVVLGDLHAVAAVFLGPVERAVGALHQMLQRVAPAQSADAEARGDAVDFRERFDRDQAAQLFRERGCFVHVGTRRQDQEFFAAPAADAVRVAQVLAHQSGDAGEDQIAGLVAVDVVDPLEVIDVEDHQRQLESVAVGATDFRGGESLELVPVPEAGQAILGRQFFECGIAVAQFLLARLAQRCFFLQRA